MEDVEDARSAVESIHIDASAAAAHVEMETSEKLKLLQQQLEASEQARKAAEKSRDEAEKSREALARTVATAEQALAEERAKYAQLQAAANRTLCTCTRWPC